MNVVYRTKIANMKFHKLLFTLVAVVALNVTGHTIVPSSHTESAGNERHSEKEQYRLLQMKRYVAMTPGEYEKYRGKNLNFLERISFKLSQHRMRQLLEQYSYGDGPTTLQKISWLLKGLLFGPLALIVGYIFFKDEERELIKWIWFGFVGFAAILVATLLAI